MAAASTPWEINTQKPIIRCNLIKDTKKIIGASWHRATTMFRSEVNFQSKKSQKQISTQYLLITRDLIRTSSTKTLIRKWLKDWHCSIQLIQKLLWLWRSLAILWQINLKLWTLKWIDNLTGKQTNQNGHQRCQRNVCQVRCRRGWELSPHTQLQEVVVFNPSKLREQKIRVFCNSKPFQAKEWQLDHISWLLHSTPANLSKSRTTIIKNKFNKMHRI